MSLADDLKTELKNRIKVDMTPFGKWNETLWTKITFGDYYGKSEVQIETIRRVVGETVDNVIRPGGWRMTIDSWNDLQGDIDATDTAETALPDMEEAASVVEPIPQGGASHLVAASRKAGSKKSSAKKKKKSAKKG